MRAPLKGRFWILSWKVFSTRLTTGVVWLGFLHFMEKRLMADRFQLCVNLEIFLCWFRYMYTWIVDISKHIRAISNRIRDIFVSSDLEISVNDLEIFLNTDWISLRLPLHYPPRWWNDPKQKSTPSWKFQLRRKNHTKIHVTIIGWWRHPLCDHIHH